MKKEFDTLTWAYNTNIYEVNVRQYTPEGSFNAFQSHIPRLKDMGIKTLWFMPITPISMKNRKGSLGSYYACSSYTKINPELGTIDDFKKTVTLAHQAGMKVIIDWVANHTGWDHEWTNTHPDFYKHDVRGDFYDAHGWEDVIDLEFGNPQLRTAMIESMKYWIHECDIDGFRCDMAMLTPVDFWMQARKSLETLKKLFWLAELDPLEHPEYMQVFDSAYTWRWMNETLRFKGDGAHHIHALRQLLNEYHHNTKDFLPAWFTSNHDENSWNGTEYEKYAEMALPLAVFSTTWSGLPLMYSGQELPNLKRLSFFEKDCIQWQHPVALHYFYKILFEIRQHHPSFSGRLESQHFSQIQNNVAHHILSYKRMTEQHCCLVMINFSNYDLNAVAFQGDVPAGEYTEIFSREHLIIDSKFQNVDLKKWGYKVWVN